MIANKSFTLSHLREFQYEQIYKSESNTYGKEIKNGSLQIEDDQ